MLYQLPKNFPAQSLDRPGNLGALHLRPGELVDLSEADLALLRSELPSIARGLVKNSGAKISKAKREALANARNPKAPKREKEEETELAAMEARTQSRKKGSK